MMSGIYIRTCVFILIFVLFYPGSDAKAQDFNRFRNVSPPEIASSLKNIARSEPAKTSALNSPVFTSNDPIDLNNLGVKYVLENNGEDAILVFERAVRLDPRFAAAYLNLSIAYEQKERFADALGAAVRAVDLVPDNIRARLQLCQLRVVTKDHPGAVACYETIKDHSAMDELAYLGYGAALINLKEARKALIAFEESARLAPNFAPAHCGIGLVRFQNKKYKEAAAAFRRALEIDPEKPTLRYNLALAELGNKNRAAAVSQYAFLKETDPDLAKRLYKILYADQVIYVGNK